MNDPEIEALGLIAKALAPLSEDQIRNVLIYVHSRYGDAQPALAPQAGEPHPAAQPDQPEDIGDLFDRCRPQTESERVLVAAYWLQAQTDSRSFEALPVNRELKQLGYSVSNITRALDSLIGQDPSLVIQVGKSGSSQQSRKQYKLTREGRRRVRGMAGIGLKVPSIQGRSRAHAQLAPSSGFSKKTELTPKQFLHEKEPQTDVERIACLAYYLAHYRDQSHFKTVDLSRLNTEAAQLKFSNTAVAASNADRRGLIAAAGKGLRQISAVGELFVDALPDRAAAKQVLGKLKPRKRNSTGKKKGSK